MNKTAIWRWVGIVVVMLVLLGMAVATVSAQPKPLRQEPASTSPFQKPPPPKPEISPKVETSSDEALQKLAPDLRERAKSPSGRPILVSVLLLKEVKLDRVMERVVYAKSLNGLRWAVGEVLDSNLKKLAGIPGVVSVVSTETYQPVPAPGEEEFKSTRPGLTPAELRQLLQKGGKNLLRQKLQEMRPTRPQIERPTPPGQIPEGDIAPTTVKVRDIHGAGDAHTKGFTGSGVIAAVVDSGVDFGHPDLQGTQARIPSGSPYAGWPFAYNTLSGVFYALGEPTIGPDTYWYQVQSTWYAHTLPVQSPTCNGITCTATLKIDFGNEVGWSWPPVSLPFVWPDTSKSGQYYYTVHPDFNHLSAGFVLGLGYAATDVAPAAVIVADETTAGVYDTVYVDVDFDQDLTNEKPMRKGDELAGADLYDAAGDPGTDGVWDLSAGMLTWIADGINPPPGVSALYSGLTVPQAGRLLSFVGDEDGHGTNCAGDIAAQGVITDPEWVGPINPLFAGAVNAGGVDGPVLAGMAPDAKVAAFQNGFALAFDSWALAALGFDGVPNSGDEAQIVNNSWGASATINDGWDQTSRFAHWLNRNYAPNTTFLVATGNGGHGYGTVTEPDGGSIIDVGASTSYGSLIYFEFVDPNQFTYGAVQPWSNRGPGTLGDIAPDVVAVGAWGTGANPLNLYYGNGQAAYDLFGGTSMATPIAAGNLALVYQAFYQKNSRWPIWQEAKAILLNSARDLGYDVLTQGSGNVNADRGTDIAAGLNNGYWVEPAQWVAGNYRGTEYPAFPAILHPGGTASKTFTVRNTSTSTYNVNLADVVLKEVGVVTYTLSFPSFGPPPFTRPTWITDITNLIDTHDPDLVRAQVVFPYSVFDTNGDNTADDGWRVLFYDWSDLNNDADLWTDTNSNNLVDGGEIDSGEYNRFTYGYPTGTYLEASVGRDSLSRRHDGVFFGVQRRTGSDPVTLQVRITFYKKVDWSWLSLSSSSVSLPAGGSATFNASMAVPANAQPGLYQGAIEVSYGTQHKHVIPVVVHVAANSPSFTFGASSLSEPLGDTPYDNGHLFGGFDWTWRYEAGDWKLYYFDVPDGTAGPGKAMVVDTQWVITPTDVDTWIYAATPDFYSTSDPAFFGPQGVEQVGGSNDTNIGAGIFTFDTATGGPREVVAGEIRNGLGFIALHNVLYAGSQIGEPIVGRAYQVQAAPVPVEMTTTQVVNFSPIQFGDSWVETFSTNSAISEGLGVLTYGLSQPQSWSGVNLPPGSTLCDWSYSFSVANGGLIEATAQSTNINDIDLYLYKGSILVASSTTATASEQIRVKQPSDGSYKVCVDNWSGTPGTFNLNLRVIQGNDLVVSGLPSGAIAANTPINFTVSFTKTASANTTWEGLLYIGPASAPTAIEIPVTIHIASPAVLLNVEKAASAEWVQEGDVFTYTITVKNLGTVKEYVTVSDPLPPLVEFVLGSQTASKGTLLLNPITRTATWTNWVNGGETVTLKFRVKAQSGQGWVENVVYVEGDVSTQQLEAMARTFVNPFRLFLPLISRSP